MLKEKEVAWKTAMIQLRKTQNEELKKARANVKMVEAAQKVVQLNAETKDVKAEDAEAVVVVK